MPFFTYRDDNKKLDGIFATQAEANTRGGTAGITAHNGEIATAQRVGQSIDAINVSLSENWWYNSGVIQDHDPALSENTIALREAFGAGHIFLDREAMGIQQYRGSVRREILDLIETEHLHLHEANYAVAHSSAYTVAQKLAFARALPQGATDAVNLRGLILYLQALNSLPQIPDVPIYYVRPDTGARLTVVQALTQSASTRLAKPPSNIILDGSWTETLTA